MSALGPMSEEAPPLQPENPNTKAAEAGQISRNKPILSAGTGL
jgi:two-component system cell cycle sensor histidine kinase PleC